MSSGGSAGLAPRFRPSPAPKRTIIEIAARRRIEPFRQGELDMLCGLYSCINALRLAAHDRRPISRPLAKELFGEGMAYLDQKEAAGETAQQGMLSGRQRRLLAHLTKHLRTKGIEMAIERPFASSRPDITDVFSWMEAAIGAGWPVMAWLKGTHNHFTVIAGIDSKQLHLFDSTIFCRIRREKCGTRQGVHILAPKDLVGLRGVA